MIRVAEKGPPLRWLLTDNSLKQLRPQPSRSEAFWDRGGGDFLVSHDLEDIVTVTCPVFF